jgi:hypothetical protein
LEAVELAIRAAMTRLGAGLLARLLALDAGHPGPRIECGLATRHPHPALSRRQRPLGRDLDATTQPDNRRLSSRSRIVDLANYKMSRTRAVGGCPELSVAAATVVSWLT